MLNTRVRRWLVGTLVAGGGLIAHFSAMAKTLNVSLSETAPCVGQAVSGLASGYKLVSGVWTFDCGMETTAGDGSTHQNTTCSSSDNAVKADVNQGSTHLPTAITSPWTAAVTTSNLNCSGGGTAHAGAWGS
jgi:hypothetical protein